MERILPLPAFAARSGCERIQRGARLSLVAALLGAIWSPPVHAHDIYSNLRDRHGKSCCNEHDCRPAHFRVAPEGVFMLVEGSWLRVPNEVILYRHLMGDRGETRGGHWCGVIDRSQDGPGYSGIPPRVTHCAVVPPGFALARLDSLHR
jgi:hypothetical protein